MDLSEDTDLGHPVPQLAIHVDILTVFGSLYRRNSASALCPISQTCYNTARKNNHITKIV